jgi:hypothetical protein
MPWFVSSQTIIYFGQWRPAYRTRQARTMGCDYNITPGFTGQILLRS